LRTEDSHKYSKEEMIRSSSHCDRRRSISRSRPIAPRTNIPPIVAKPRFRSRELLFGHWYPHILCPNHRLTLEAGHVVRAIHYHAIPTSLPLNNPRGLSMSRYSDRTCVRSLALHICRAIGTITNHRASTGVWTARVRRRLRTIPLIFIIIAPPMFAFTHLFLSSCIYYIGYSSNYQTSSPLTFRSKFRSRAIRSDSVYRVADRKSKCRAVRCRYYSVAAVAVADRDS
jgi:hypothetical protein